MNKCTTYIRSMPSVTMASSDPTRATAVSYFYGRISRDEAEQILTNHGKEDGLFLLRENVLVAGNYALSICHSGRIHHYCIEHQQDGSVKIPDGRPFAGPVELINHHSRYLDGFITKPCKPCARHNGVAPMAWPGVTMLELEQVLLEAANAKKIRGSKLENVLGPQRQKFVSMIAKTLHEEQAWYHGSVKREDADRIMDRSGHVDGKYLMRSRDRDSFALSISFQRATKHYRVDRHKSGSVEKWAIEDGPKFDNLMDMVAHYYCKPDGLLCKLTTPCIRDNYRKKIRTLSGTSNNPIYGAPVQDTGMPQAAFEGNFDEPEIEVSRPLPPPPVESTADMQKIYDSVPRTDEVFKFPRKDLDLTTELGAGNFGSVMQGIYKQRTGKGYRDVPVAVKRLKNADASGESELMVEAKLMAGLENKYIVRMIGVCRTSSEGIMLVLELAPLGPLHKFLKKNPLPMISVCRLMQQVAEGMAYLETKSFVHRDLAARNVLLASEDLAKISDFGMSKALGIGNEYYKAEAAGKWPLKWYAPECIYFFKFDTKSDVWSYGVTLWEATSYGGKPYRGLKGAQIIEMIDHGERMEKPDQCPDTVYDIMRLCWERKSEDRPSFKQIVQRMTSVISEQ